MKMKMKRITGLLLALFMTMGCLSLNPITSYADDTDPNTFNINKGNVNIKQGGNYTIEGTGQPTSNTISVTGSNIAATITLKNVKIDVSNQDEQKAFLAKNYDQSNVHLTIILEGTNSLRSSDSWAGLTWNNSDNSSTLEIKGNGSLTAKCWRHGAGIGSSWNNNGTRNISITGGTVTATGGDGAAGIGGGESGLGKNITIFGGTVTATGGYQAAGIGGGNYGSGENIKISGGTVTATGGTTAAGIGGGNYGSGENIKISGGTVTATGGTAAAGIGGGLGNPGKNITITGGTVTATSGQYGVGIGGNSAGNIKISGGSVKASSISTTPTDGNDHNVYLAKLENQDGVNEVTVYSGTENAKTFTRAGNYPDRDTAFYLYLTGKDHDLDTSKGKYKAKWHSNTNGFTIRPEHGVVHIDADNFPNEPFRSYVKQFDVNKDGWLSKEELEKVEKISIENQSVSDLKGIEYFTNLKSLHCSHNELKSLDLSKNTELIKLYCSQNKLASLSLTNNPKLAELSCHDNNLKELDVSHNPKLTKLDCHKNWLTSLDLRNNKELTELDCSGNKLNSLNLSNNPKLTKLDCNNNYLTSLDLRNNTELIELDCNNNWLTSLDSSNNKDLTSLNCSNNDLPSLDLSNNTKLSNLNCGNQRYNIVLKGTKEFKYSNFPGKFDKEKVKSLVGASLGDDALIVNDDNPREVTYKYKVGYKDKEMDVKLTVGYMEFDSGHIKSAKVITQPTLSYTEGEKLDLTGLVVMLEDDNHMTKTVPFSELGRYSVTATPANGTFLTVVDHDCKHVKLTFSIPGVPVKFYLGQTGILMVKKFDSTHVTSMTVKHQPSKLSYTEGGNLDLTGLEVTLEDANHAKKVVTPAQFEANGIKATPKNGTKLVLTDNTKKVKLTKDGVPSVETEKLTVNKLNPTSMSVTSQPTKLKYTEGETLDLTGLEVTLEDANHVKKVVTPAQFEANGIKAAPKNGKKLELTDGGNPVTLTKDGLQAVKTSNLAVEELKPTSMSVTSQPTKLKYTEGETLDLTGLEVTLEDANHVKKVVTPAGFTANNIMATPGNGKKLELTDGGKPVKLTRGNLTAETGALQVKQQSSGSGSAGGAGVGAGSSTGHGSSAGMNDDAPTTVDNGELNIQIDGAESDYKPGYAGDGFSNANAGNAGNANAGSAPEVKQPDADVKQSADTLALAQAQVDAAARKLADAPKLQTVTPAPKSQSEKPAPKPQSEKRIGMIPKTDKSASFAGLIALYAGLIAVLGFSIAGLAIFCKKKMMEENIK